MMDNGFLYVFVSTVNVILDMNSLKGVRPCRKGGGARGGAVQVVFEP